MCSDCAHLRPQEDLDLSKSVAIGPEESVSRSARSLRSGLGFGQLFDVRQVLLSADEPLVIDEILLGNIESGNVAVMPGRRSLPCICESDALQGCQEVDPQRFDAQLDDLFGLEEIPAHELDVREPEFTDGLHDAIRVRRRGLNDDVDVLRIAGLGLVAEGETADDQIPDAIVV